MAEKYKFDFSGYATKNDLKCADGRIIRKDAFKDCDGEVVPLVWQHKHGEPANVLGHCVLVNKDDGVYAFGSFNETESGKNARELVRHGDVRALSIYANQLVQKGNDVLHGMIREVSLCLAGANPGAMIEDLSFAHFDDPDEEFEANIWNGNNIEYFYHSDDETNETDEAEAQDGYDEYNEYDDPEPNPDDYIGHSAMREDNSMNDRTLNEIYEGMTDEQKMACQYMVGIVASEAEPKEEDYEDDEGMKHNAFYGDDVVYGGSLAHDFENAVNSAIADGKSFGSLREAFKYQVENGELAHAIDTTGMTVPEIANAAYAESVGYGINGVDYLYPEARNLNPTPEFIKRDTDWVDVVWNDVHRTPFSRIKSVFANITEDEARAKGYIKGNQKKNEFFSLIKRVTVPQTVYKKQTIDRDDIIDITDINIVNWIRQEMRLMWNEETARAMLIGDGRDSNDSDRISPEHIRPIVSDAPLFTIQKTVARGSNDETTAKNFMNAAIRARKDYRGSGNPTLFTTEDNLTSMLLIEDGLGHHLYKSEAELATAMRVSKIVTVPVMENFTLANGNELMGIIVNLRDYNVGTDKGGEINTFDDFDIDFNQYKYLIEARCSGALIKPFSAITLSVAPANNNSGNDGNSGNP